MSDVRRTWEEELAIVDHAMKAVSRVDTPEEMVDVYWSHIGELMPGDDYVTLSRRGVEPPDFIVTRSSRWESELNPWTERDRLPRLRGGLLGELAYAERPVYIDDLPARLSPDDPGWFYLQGFARAVVSPQYENGVAMNISVMLLPPGKAFDVRLMPVLHWQSGLFGRATQGLVLRRQLKAALKRLDREVQVVGDIQRSLLPRELPKVTGFDFAAHYRTSAQAGGDYYDFFPIGENGWGLFIADVAGHGTPAAVLMAITHAIAHTRPGDPVPPGEVLAHLNRHLCGTYTSNGTFITAFYAALDPVRRTLTYATAGHNPPRLLRRGQVQSLDGAAGLPLGIMPDLDYAETTIPLEAGDLLLLYTDGITEAKAPREQDGSADLFGVDRLDALLRRCSTTTAAETIECVRCAVAEFTNHAPPGDDETLVAMRVAR
jgi:sigma-B regulation protein RsbU (phosphoserine phosphatase)